MCAATEFMRARHARNRETKQLETMHAADATPTDSKFGLAFHYCYRLIVEEQPHTRARERSMNS